MNRSDFIRVFLFGTAATATGTIATVSTAEPPARKLRYLYSGPINGVFYYDAEEVYDQLRHNDALSLRLEPLNEHDHRAIEVLWHDRKLGYLPRKDNKILYNLLKDGTTLEARLKKDDALKRDDLDSLYDMLRVRVWMVGA